MSHDTPDFRTYALERDVRHAALARHGDIAPVIDHTLLRPDAAQAAVEQLCREGLEHGFATVCVNPVWVPLCARLIGRGSGVPETTHRPGVCAVVGFPFGATLPDVKAYEARRAIADGANEIDMVIDVGALKSGNPEAVERDIAAVAAVCSQSRALLKVIIEAALLSDEEKVAACVAAARAGADYVKTSTGFGPGGATIADVALLRRTVGARMGVKASGGVRDLATARAMLEAGATRIGTSAGVRIVQELRGHGARMHDG